MVSPTLAVTALVHALTGFAFLYVGRAIALRVVAPEDRFAGIAYRVWWMALGAYLLIQSALHFLAATGNAPLAIFLAARVVTPALLAASVWGITFHILFLYTGRASLGRPLAIFFALAGLGLYYASFVPMPASVRVDPWLAELDGTGEGAVYRAVYVLLGAPPLLASLGYLLAIRRADAPEARYRISLVGGSILLYIATGLAARLVAGDLAKFITLPVFGLATAGAAVLAYRPPRAWIDRMRAPRPNDAGRKDAFARRIRELV